jgi:hypothetical protein
LKEENNYEGGYNNMIDKNYELKEIEPLGKGGNALVLKCFDKKSWKFYALKIMNIYELSLMKVAEEIKTMITIKIADSNKFA